MTDLREIPDNDLLAAYEESAGPQSTFGDPTVTQVFTPNEIIDEMERRTTPGTRFDINRFRMGLFPPHKTDHLKALSTEKPFTHSPLPRQPNEIGELIDDRQPDAPGTVISPGCPSTEGPESVSRQIVNRIGFDQLMDISMPFDEY